MDATFINGINGLTAQEQRLSVISDNIANAQTIGYKRADIYFSSLMNDTNATAPTLQTSSVKTKPIRIPGVQGDIAVNTSNTNMALQGKGFFIVNTKADGTGDFLFTRDGSFEPNTGGTFVNKAGQFLMGFPTSVASYTPAIETAAVTKTAATPTALRNVSVARDSVLQTAAGTTAAAVTGTIPPLASQTVGTAFTNTLTVLDGSLNSHDITLTYTTTASGYTLAGSSSDGAITVSSGTTPITIGSSTPLTITAAWTTPATATSSVALDISALTQNSTQFTARAAATDGNANGSLKSFQITDSGLINARLTNGNIVTVGQIAVANFRSENNLQAVNGNAFRLTDQSGLPTITSANGTGSDTSKAIGSALEGSNVDLGEELSTLIVVQRAYSFNSTVLKTADEMTRTASELKK